MNTHKIFIQLTNICWIIGGITVIAFGIYLANDPEIIAQVVKRKKILEFIHSSLGSLVVLGLFGSIGVFLTVAGIKSFLKGEKF